MVEVHGKLLLFSKEILVKFITWCLVSHHDAETSSMDNEQCSNLKIWRNLKRYCRYYVVIWKIECGITYTSGTNSQITVSQQVPGSGVTIFTYNSLSSGIWKQELWFVEVVQRFWRRNNINRQMGACWVRGFHKANGTLFLEIEAV